MTAQEKLTDLYTSESLVERAVGLWLKLIFEFFVVAVPIFTLVVLASFLHSDIRLSLQVTPSSLLVIAGGLSVTVTQISWCFSTG